MPKGEGGWTVIVPRGGGVPGYRGPESGGGLSLLRSGGGRVVVLQSPLDDLVF